MTETDGESPVVLIVEDEKDLADLYAEWLADTYDVITAYTSEEALDNLTDDIDVALLDRRLPGVSGDGVIEHIHERGLDIQVAIVSAITPDFAVIGLGIEDYLVKPVNEQDVVDLVERMLKRATYTEIVQEIEQLKSAKETIEAEMDQAELAQNEEYHELREEIEELEEQATATAEDLNDDI